MSKKNRSFFIDTDAGTDDAIALIMAMRYPDINIVGISTSGGNVPLDCVVQNVLYVREMCEHSAPVYVGAAQPLHRILGTADFIHGKDGLGDIGLKLEGRNPNEGAADDMLIEALIAHEGELEIVCLGPLTNLALVERKSPGVLKKAKKVYIMGGLVTLPGNVTPMSEYNIWADPEAADEVFASGAEMMMIGWDTTLCSSDISIAEMADIRAMETDFSRFAADIQKVRIEWMDEHLEETTVNLADPLAMAVAMDHSLIESRDQYEMTVRCGQDEDPYRGYIEAKKVKNKRRGIDFIHQANRQRYIDLIRFCLS